MIIATWNVNSLKARLELLLAWLRANTPDIMLLQELKGVEFPADVFKELGYESAAVTQKTYNGVAVLSRHPLEIVSTTLPGDEADSHARYLEVLTAGLRVVNIYAPNGNPIGTEKFAYKLAWLDRLMTRMHTWRNDAMPTLIGGDFNSIPEDMDCHKPASWAHDALFQPAPRAAYRAMQQLGFTDAFRSLHPETSGEFTYWDYFRDAFARNRGIRIDHFLLTPQLATRIESCTIDKHPRAQPRPSDHTPVVLRLRDNA